MRDSRRHSSQYNVQMEQEESPKEIARKRIYLKKKRRRARRIRFMILVAELVILGIVLLFTIRFFYKTFLKSQSVSTMNEKTKEQNEEPEIDKAWYKLPFPRPDIEEDFIVENEFSRPGEPLEKIEKIFIHYTANPGTSAAQNRSYFASLAETGETSASSHFVIGYEGEIIQCLPLDEIGYAVKENNFDSVSIECCYQDEDGKFTKKTYNQLIELVTWLLHEYNLTPADVYRHYDAGGKNCPKYYVENEYAWKQFKVDLRKEIKKTSIF